MGKGTCILRPTDTTNTAKVKYFTFIDLLILLVDRMRTHTDAFICFCCCSGWLCLLVVMYNKLKAEFVLLNKLHYFVLFLLFSGVYASTNQIKASQFKLIRMNIVECLNTTKVQEVTGKRD